MPLGKTTKRNDETRDMLNLFVAAVFFVGTHMGISSSPLRAQLIENFGERTYRLLYSLVAAVGVVWMVFAYRQASLLFLWPPAPWLNLIPLVLLPLAFILLVGALSGPNPTAMGQQIDPDTSEPARGMIRVSRHPLMWAITIWALSHIIALGDAASVTFFGAFAVLGLLGMISIDHRRTQENAPGWGIFVQSTSITPFAAILEKRQRFVWQEIGWRRVLMALVLYALFLVAHPWLFGAAAIG